MYNFGLTMLKYPILSRVNNRKMKVKSHFSWTILRLTLILILLLVSSSWGYTPPKGIPNPSASFSTFGEIDQATPSWPTEWTAEVKSEKTNYYYIDKTEAGCSDGRSYGYPGYARCLPPEGALAEGSYVYIHAGTYTPEDSGSDRFDWHGAGTATNPIWITGNAASKPVLTDTIHIALAGSASYIILDNLTITGASIFIQPYNDSYDADHIIVRNCTLTGTGTSGDSSGISIGLSQGTDSFPNATVEYVVVYKNTISLFGDDGNPGSDECGIEQGFHTNYKWVLNNTISDVGADAVCGSHYSNYTDRLTSNYFIGGNLIYSNGENCIDIKVTDGVIISENICTGPAAREGGGGIALHYGQNNFPCKNAWVLYNKVYTLSGGVGMGGSFGCDDCHYVGNIFYDISNDYAPTPDASYGGYLIQIGGSHGAMSIVDNTFYDYQRGIYVEDLTTGDTLKIHGNIFYRTDGAGPDIMLTDADQDTYVDMDYNRFYNAGGAAAFYWNGDTRNLTYIKDTASECANCSEGDPGLVNPPSSLRLATGSACIGSAESTVNTESATYDLFATTWAALGFSGLSIEKDYVGNARPKDTYWDIGAYEYDANTILPVHSFGSGATTSWGSGAGHKFQ